MLLQSFYGAYLFGAPLCVCVYSNSRNDVPLVAQRYGTIAAHTRRRTSVLVVYVVFCVHVYSFAGLIRRTPPPTFSDTAITDHHSDTTIFQLRAHWVRISWSTGSEKSFGHVPPVGVEPSTSCVLGEHPITRPGSLLFGALLETCMRIYMVWCEKGRSVMCKQWRLGSTCTLDFPSYTFNKISKWE